MKMTVSSFENYCGTTDFTYSNYYTPQALKYRIVFFSVSDEQSQIPFEMEGFVNHPSLLSSTKLAATVVS